METQTTSKTHTGEMSIMGREGDTKVIWDKNRPVEVENARETFKRLRKEGYLAFKVTGKDGVKGEQINEFDPNQEVIIFAPQMQGG